MAMGMLNPDVDPTQIAPDEPAGNDDAQEPVVALMVVLGFVLVLAIIPS